MSKVFRFKFGWWTVAVGGAIAYLLVAILVTIAVLFNSEASSCVSQSEADGGTASAGATGAWTQQGTDAYKNAKAVFDYWTGKGMSGAQAAGIVGNIGGAEDKGFVLDKKEEGGGSGGGLYQFTPYSKYLNNSKSDKSWSVQNQSDVVIALEPQTMKSFFEKTKSGTPEEAAEAWMNLYERPSASARSQTLGDRQKAARTAYELFGGSSISAKDSFLGGVVSSGDAGASAEESSDTCSTSAGSGEDWGWPFKSIKNNKPQISGEQLFGASQSRPSGFHDGVDFGNANYGGEDILAVHSGKVIEIGYKGSTQSDLGCYVVTKGSDKYYVIYQEFAFSKEQGAKYLKVKEGDEVKTGQTIAQLAKRGEGGSPEITHVHIGVADKKLPRVGNYAQSDWYDVTKLITGSKTSGDATDDSSWNSQSNPDTSAGEHSGSIIEKAETKNYSATDPS